MEGLIHAGTGKTVIAAFDYRNFRKSIRERLADFYSYSPRRNPAPKPGYFPGCTARLMGVSFAELSAVQLRMTQTASSETMKDSAETSAFESFTAIDNDACSVAIRSIDPNSSWGHEIQVALENKSPDKTYMFAVETATVNGVETDPFFADEVNPGKKANGSILRLLSESRETEICNLILVENYP